MSPGAQHRTISRSAAALLAVFRETLSLGFAKGVARFGFQGIGLTHDLPGALHVLPSLGVDVLSGL